MAAFGLYRDKPTEPTGKSVSGNTGSPYHGVASILGLGELFASGQECFVSNTLHNISDLRRTEEIVLLGSMTVVTPRECLLSMRISG